MLDQDWLQARYTLIQTHLTAIVPLLIHEIKSRGGPDERDYARARDYGLYLATHGDAIMFREKGKTGEAMSKLTEGLAVLAFCPGGVSVFGLTFDASASQVCQTDRHKPEQTA